MFVCYETAGICVFVIGFVRTPGGARWTGNARSFSRARSTSSSLFVNQIIFGDCLVVDQINFLLLLLAGK